jgi:hypothetical protein
MKYLLVAAVFTSGEFNSKDEAWTVNSLYKGIKGSLS